MMDMFKNQPKYLINAKKQSIESKEFSLDNMTKKFEEIINKYYKEQSQEVKLQLPKLKKVDSTTTEKLDIKLPSLKKV